MIVWENTIYFLTSTYFTVSVRKIVIHGDWDVTYSYVWHFSKRGIWYFRFKYKFGANWWSSCSRVVSILSNRFYFLLSKQEFFFSFRSFLKKYETKGNFLCNKPQNNLILCCFFGFLFITEIEFTSCLRSFQKT